MKATCPSCGLEFEAPRHEKGAGYALQWDRLPDNCKNLLAWWLSNSYKNNERMTKDQIKTRYNGTTIGGIMGRVSELYALGLVDRHERTKPTYPTVTYTLNIDKAVKVLNNGGKLKQN